MHYDPGTELRRSTAFITLQDGVRFSAPKLTAYSTNKFLLFAL